MDGEENGAEGRAFGHVATGSNAGSSFQLPALGRFSWENSVANPGTGDRTVVAGTDDAGGGQVYFYYGDKKSTGNEVEKAGLTGGDLYGLKVAGLSNETDASSVTDGTEFSLVSLGDVSAKTGAEIQTSSVAGGVSGFQRPEDGSWDPTDPHVFYFVTTAGINTMSRLWRLTFDDPADPAAGGTIDEVLKGDEGQKMFDNITVDDRGQVLLQEDVGNNARLGKIWLYDPSSDSLTEVAHRDPSRFSSGGTQFITEDEESSGIIEAPFLGAGKYLLDVQNHKGSSDPELVEGGQLLVLQLPAGFPH
jgi:secreted PhoX family phosphatase